MTSTQKIILWIVGGLAALAAAIVIGAVLWWRGNSDALRQAMADGRALGAGVTAAQCVDTVLTLHAAQPGLTHTLPQSIFFSGCIDKARELPALCAQNPNPGIVRTAQWTTEMCRRRGLSDPMCTNVLQPLVTACRTLAERRPT